MVYKTDICSINDDATFEAAALETFRFQASQCDVYRDYIASIGIAPTTVNSVEQIPYLPIEMFKWRDVYCGKTPAEMVFTSSNTGGTTASSYAMHSLALYEKAFTTVFCTLYGGQALCRLYGLLPSYLVRIGSSIMYMVVLVIAVCV